MRTWLRSQLVGYYRTITCRRYDSFVECFPAGFRGNLLALGLGNGELTRRVAHRVAADSITAIEIDTDHFPPDPNFRVLKSDLNEPFPVEDNSIDWVSSDQVIEHLHDVDSFVEETYRVLKPGGRAVIATENLSGWHNVGALALGYQAFAQTISAKHVIGNPFSARHFNGDARSRYWNHVHLFTLKGLKDLFQKNGFQVEAEWGIGYFPLPSRLSPLMEYTDPSHAYFIGIRVRK